MRKVPGRAASLSSVLRPSERAVRKGVELEQWSSYAVNGRALMMS
jgi:hypothetical protein